MTTGLYFAVPFMPLNIGGEAGRKKLRKNIPAHGSSVKLLFGGAWVFVQPGAPVKPETSEIKTPPI